MRSRTAFDRPRFELPLPRGCEFGVAPNAPRRAVINVRVGCFYLLWFASRKEGAGPLKQMPWARGADGVEGPGSALPQQLDHSLRADRRLERKESELPRAFAWASAHAAFSVGKVVSAFCELPCQRVGVLRGGSREQMNATEGLQYGWLSRRSADDFRARNSLGRGTHRMGVLGQLD